MSVICFILFICTKSCLYIRSIYFLVYWVHHHAVISEIINHMNYSISSASVSSSLVSQTESSVSICKVMFDCLFLLSCVLAYFLRLIYLLLQPRRHERRLKEITISSFLKKKKKKVLSQQEKKQVAFWKTVMCKHSHTHSVQMYIIKPWRNKEGERSNTQTSILFPS